MNRHERRARQEAVEAGRQHVGGEALEQAEELRRVLEDLGKRMKFETP